MIFIFLMLKWVSFYVALNSFLYIHENVGVVPRLCEETFNRIAKLKSDAENKIEYEVTF